MPVEVQAVRSAFLMNCAEKLGKNSLPTTSPALYSGHHWSVCIARIIIDGPPDEQGRSRLNLLIVDRLIGMKCL